MDLLRDSTLGQIIRFVCRNRCLLYPDEKPNFKYSFNGEGPQSSREKLNSDVTTHTNSARFSSTLSPSSQTGLQDPEALTDENERAWKQSGLANNLYNEEKKSSPYGKETILVDWYDERDPENPKNWSTGKKVVVTIVHWIYTFTVYCASAIYTPSIEGVQAEYNVSHIVASLGLSLYVLGYGIGPLVFSPLSEIPRIGRNLPHSVTLFLFVLLAIPTVLVKSFAGFLVLRFLTGVLGSPCLATGGATLSDMYSPLKLPYAHTAWVGATFCAPALGPVLSGFAVASNDWRWSLWEILWMAVFTFIIMLAFFPETSAATILLRRAQRIRKREQDNRYVSQSEIDDAKQSASQIATQALIRPLQITFMDPAVLFTNLYSSYSYGVYYSFFEAFPLVYTGTYGFSLGLTGTAFLSIVIACLVGSAIYEAKLKRRGPGLQEERLLPAVLASILQPAGLFLFAWTSRSDVHWIFSMIGIALFSTGGFILFQGIFMYLPLSYPDYAASLFAANDFCRSAWAAGAVLYARPLFDALGIARGISLLAGLSFAGVVGVFALYYFGATLRARSKFAQP
ncbi:hypothetical protein M409DRAFT_71545 [Zasmidium cellare ATCC 36951]|uniref:Cercosporin MFS transporter CTB4 n=1 Tax=Zasmidium cellare ATCC 36951 TaxID=1080233 RepID=A0A6A6BV69_ZASCE|nr:uncharacterized protein M409DRAFT_71545 [Zasmidium cellare ATCC 36951]KAF2158651.1 hypothetical protein M409DRAFT_71545 [Zasmidium cellare ATCC 36951]